MNLLLPALGLFLVFYGIAAIPQDRRNMFWSSSSDDSYTSSDDSYTSSDDYGRSSDDNRYPSRSSSDDYTSSTTTDEPSKSSDDKPGPSPSGGDSFCDVVDELFEDEMRRILFWSSSSETTSSSGGDFASCSCEDQKLGFTATCSVNFMDVETISVVVDVEPCAKEAEASLKITDSDLGLDFPIADIGAGDSEKIDTGADIGIPIIGDIGLYVTVGLEGNAESLSFDFGLDGCAELLGETLCGGDIPGVDDMLPVTVFSGGPYQFDDLCERRRA